jgi:uncharacterized membrane protein YjjB (DUF3815 family)
VVGTVQDAISGYYVTAAGRVAEIALQSAGLLTGVVLGLRLGFAADVALEVSGDVSGSIGRFWVSVVVASAAAGGYALAGYAPWRSLVISGAAGAAGWGVYRALTQYAGLGPIAATGAAAIVVGAAAGLLRRTREVPSLVVTLAGITPLLPGLTAYRGFYQLAVEGLSEGLVTISVAAAIGLALAAGVTFGDFLTRPRRLNPLTDPVDVQDGPDSADPPSDGERQ